MTTKQLLLTAVIVVFMGIAAFHLGAQQEAALPNSRYALVQGEYVFIPSKGTILNERGLFRIDTVTGKTWRFVFHDADASWDPVDERRSH